MKLTAERRHLEARGQTSQGTQVKSRRRRRGKGPPSKLDRQVGRKWQRIEKIKDIDTFLSKFDRPDDKKRILRSWNLSSLQSRPMAEKIKELELSPEQKKRVKLFIQAFEEKSASLENGMEKGTMESRMYVLLVN